MRVQIKPGVWEDIGPVRHVGKLKATGYTIASSPMPTIESDEQALEAKTNQVGKRKWDGKHYRVIKEVVR